MIRPLGILGSTAPYNPEYLYLMKSFRFLLSSIWYLGPELGVRYWNVYRLCRRDPSLIILWERKCRWEAAQLESTDPVNSKFMDDWADLLSRCPGGSLCPLPAQSQS